MVLCLVKENAKIHFFAETSKGSTRYSYILVFMYLSSYVERFGTYNKKGITFAMPFC